MTYFRLSFYLSSGAIVEALIESEGLSLADVRDDIENSINEDATYTLLNVYEEEWVVLQGGNIEAFSIKDLGSQGLKLAHEGFIFK